MKIGEYLIVKYDVDRVTYNISFDTRTSKHIETKEKGKITFKKDQKYKITEITDNTVSILYGENGKMTFSIFDDNRRNKYYEYYKNIFYDDRLLKLIKINKSKNILNGINDILKREYRLN